MDHERRQDVTMEALEDRRLMSASVTSTAQEVDEVRLVSKASVALVNLVGSEFEGRLLVTASSGTRAVGSLSAGTVPAGSVLSVILRITNVDVKGRLIGTMAVQGLGLAGTEGPFNVAGRIRGKKITLALADSGAGVARVVGTLSKSGLIIKAKYVSRVNGDFTAGDLRLVQRRQTDFERVLGFRNIGPGFETGVGTEGSGFVFTSNNNGLFIGLSWNGVF